jgi:nucleoid-associated protein YgaU/DNA-binding SARP family transcriptional activator
MTRNRPAPHASRIGAAVRAVAALACLTLLIAGWPTLLALTIGNPVPGLQDLAVGDVSDTAVIAVLASITWVAWAQFTLAVLVEAVTLAARTPFPRRIPGVLPSQQHLARTLVTAVLVLIPAVSTFTGAAQAAQASTVAAAPAATATLQPAGQPDSPQATSPDSRARATTPTRTHTVTAQGPATYWDLAEAYLGDGQRWSEIWHLNEGRHQSDGAVMNSPGLLRVGWDVLIPTTSPEPGASSPAAGTVRVHPGDTLGAIAQEHGTTWPTLWQDNQGRTEPHGEHFTDPDHIEPGWTVEVPAPADPPASARETPDQTPDVTGEHTPSPAPTAEPGASRTSPAPSHQTRGDDTTGSVREPEHRAAATAPTPPTATPQPSPAAPTALSTTTPATAAPSTAAAAGSSSPAVPTGQAPHLPSAVSLLRHGLGPGAGLLAATALIALLRQRRRQFRYRRPGRMISATPPDLVVMEKALLTQGSASLGDVAWLDEALRALAQQITQAGGRLPDITAVRVGTDVLELVLARPADPGDPGPPAPWRGDPLTGRWQLRRTDYTPDDEEQAELRRWQFAPYPTLVSLGYSTEGDYWLLDLEQIGALTLTGDHDRCLDLARFLAADLAHNTWSELMDVVLIGFGAEVPGINPDRVSHVADAAAALTRLRFQVQTNREVLDTTGLADTLEGRQKDVAADQWMPQVLIIDDTALDEQDTAQLHALVSAVRSQRGRTGVAVVVTGSPISSPHPSSADQWQLPVDPDGQVFVQALGLTLRAQQLPAHEATQLARLLTASASLADRPMPPARGQEAWDSLADAAGAPLPALTTSQRASLADPAPAAIASNHRSPARIRVAPAQTSVDPAATGAASVRAANGGPSVGTATGSPAPTPPTPATPPTAPTPAPAELPAPNEVRSVLPQPMDSLLEATATTIQDVQALAPSVSDTARHQIEDADTDLDRDLAAWNSPGTPRPRLSVLGPVQVRSTGELPGRSPRRPWYTEVVAYLGAAHPRGVTAEQFGTDLWPGDPDITSKSKLRQSVHMARKWLGEDPDTGQPFVPVANDAPGGVGLYRIEGLLLDADLFRRLRLRGVARGTEGIADLEAALRLVTGRPFDQRRADGYAWLADTPLDHEYTGMIVDVAHLVATHYLSTGRADLAAAAAQISLLADSHDDVALLDLVAAADAQGNQGEARAWIRRILANHDAEIEEDLPPRTAEILRRRHWIT